MSIPPSLTSPLVAFLVSLSVTYVAIFSAKRLRMVDQLNHRSSHEVPTPRGGGVGIVVGFFASLAVLSAFRTLAPFLWDLVLGGSAIALLGLLDDKFSLSASFRFVIQLVVSAAVIGHYHAFSPLHDWSGWLLFLVLSVYLVWITNFYNFMDGIDGIAAIEATTVSLVFAFFHFWHSTSVAGDIYLCLALSSLGFYVFNRSPARIFMGDVGSGFLGFTLAFLSLVSMGEKTGVTLISHFILLGIFIVDSSMTLMVRLLAGKNIFRAHRDHAYQHAVKFGFSHRSVSHSVGAINLFWLAPLAALSIYDREREYLWLVVAYVPLAILAGRWRAGFDFEAISQTSE